MKKLSLTCMALAAMVAFGQTAKAAPVSTQLTLTGASGVNLFISTLGGAVTADIPFDITGTIDITLEDQIDDGVSGTATTAIALDDAAIDLSDQSLNLSLGFLGGVEGEITGAGINQLSSNGNIPLTNTNPTDPFTYTFDPGGGSPTSITIDEGLFTYLGTGPVGGLLGSGTLDFASDPIAAELGPVGQIGLVTQDIGAQVGNTVTVDVVVSAPLTFADTLLTDPVTLDVDLSGALVATGFYTYVIIPEPSTLVLLGIAFVGLVPVWRRLRK